LEPLAPELPVDLILFVEERLAAVIVMRDRVAVGTIIALLEEHQHSCISMKRRRLIVGARAAR